jgi:hypothetical protein
MEAQTQELQLEVEVAQLLSDLSNVQEELLQVLTEKRALLLASDMEGMAAMQPREAQMIVRLQTCQEERGRLLARAAADGMPADNLRTLAAALPVERRVNLGDQLKAASSRARLLEHHSLANWVVVQRTLIHLSQMLEIIATGGRLQPTYGKSESVASGGSLVDHAA